MTERALRTETLLPPTGALACGCCEGVAIRTAAAIQNRPGLSALSYRRGAHAAFFESMIAKIATYGARQDDATRANEAIPTRHLRDMLTTRDRGDAAIALLDAWATVADVITFYQERLANEGFLRTAREPRSLYELSRLVGYRPRPGISSTVHLAFEVEDTSAKPGGATTGAGGPPTSSTEILIPAGTKTKSTPTPGSEEEPQTFETSFDLIGRQEWNELKFRGARMPRLTFADLLDVDELFFVGLGLRIQPNDLIAIEADPESPIQPRFVAEVKELRDKQKTKVSLAPHTYSTIALINEIDGRLRTFLSAFTVARNRLRLDSTFYDSKRTQLLSSVETALALASSNRLEGTDAHFHELLCSEFSNHPNSSGGGAQSIWLAAQTLTTWSDSVTSALDVNSADVLGSAPIVESQYGPFHQEQLHWLDTARALFQELNSASSSQPPIGTILAKAKAAIFRSAPGQRLEQRFLIGPQSAHSVAVDDFLIPETQIIALESLPARIRITARLVVHQDGDEVETIESKLPRDASALTLELIGNEIRGLKTPKLSSAQGHRWLEVTLLDPDEDRVLGTSLHELSVGTSLPHPFPQLQTEKVIVPAANGNSFFVDDQLTLVDIGPEESRQKYIVELSTAPEVAGSFTVSQEGAFEFTEARILAPKNDDASKEELQDALRGLQFAPDDPVPQTIRVRMIFRRGSESIAAAAREIVPNSTGLTVVRRQIADLYNQVAGGKDRATALSTFAEAVRNFELLRHSLNQVASSLSPNEPLSVAMDKSQRARREWLSESTEALKELRIESIEKLNSADHVAASNVVDILERANQGFEKRVDKVDDAAAVFSQVVSYRQQHVTARIEAVSKDVSAKPLLPPLEVASAVDKLRAELEYDAVETAKAITKFRRSVEAAFNEGTSELKQRQQVFLDELDGIRHQFDGPFRNVAENSPEHAVRVSLDDFQNRLNANIDGQSCQLQCRLSYQLSEVRRFSGIALASEGSTPNGALSDSSKEALVRIMDLWTKRADQLCKIDAAAASPSPTQDMSDLGAVIHRVEALLSPSLSGSSELEKLLQENADRVAQIVAHFDPRRQSLLHAILQQTRIRITASKPRIVVFRQIARVFGWNAPAKIDKHTTNPAWPDGADAEDSRRVFLDNSYQRTLAGSVIAIRTASKLEQLPTVLRTTETATRPRSAYGVRGETTRVELEDSWWTFASRTEDFTTLRSTRVFCDPELLDLAESQLSETYPDVNDTDERGGVVVLNDPTFDLHTGKLVVVEGRPVLGTDGVGPIERSIFRIADVTHAIHRDTWGDRYVTRIRLQSPLTASYQRTTARVLANVVEATHGETQLEVLGSGDASRPFQRFLLRRGDVSQLPAPTPTGTRSALAVHVNDVTWTQQDDLISSRPDSQDFVTPANDAEQTPVVFGDGRQGARVPTGVENVRGRYRSGLGSRGNVAASQIDQLVGAPLGVKKVVNPLRAQGGADPDGLKDIRRRAPLAVTAMDRLVSLADYADFVQNYAGVGKASAARFRGVVHITLAGLDAQAFDMDGPVIRNLRQALALYGDPTQRVRLHNREASLLIVVAKVRLAADQQWNKIEPQLRRTLLDTFSYEQADLGEDALLSDAISVVQNFAGIDYVDVDVFDAVRQDEITQLANRLTRLARRPRIHVPRERLATVRIPDKESKNESSVPPTVDTPLTVIQQSTTRLRETFQPAQLCYLPPDIPGALILEQLS